MSDAEIIKALECCDNEHQCTECPMNDSYPFCADVIGGIALDLINRQKAEIEALKMDKEQLANDVYNAEMHSESTEQQLMAKSELCRKQQAEIENYKHLDVILHTAIDKLATDIKSKAIKEFAERLKEKEGVPMNMVDNLVKEMVGENVANT